MQATRTGFKVEANTIIEEPAIDSDQSINMIHEDGATKNPAAVSVTT